MRKPTKKPQTKKVLTRRGEAIILDGVPVVQAAYLEVAGADCASFRVSSDVPQFLGGQQARPPLMLVQFERSDEKRNGFAVFRPVT